MKVKKSLMAVAVLGCGVLQCAAFDLVKDGKPVAKIYHAPLAKDALPAEFNPKVDIEKELQKLTQEEQEDLTLATAIRDLNYHLKKMSGVGLEVLVTDNPKDVEAPAIVIGSLAIKMGAKPGGNSPESFCIRVADERVLIGGNSRTASYGIYELLEHLGCDWVMPGLAGEVIPETKTVSIANQDKTYTPGFPFRYIWYGGFCRSKQAAFELVLWKIRMRQLLLPPTDFKVGGHVWGNLAKKYKEEFEKDPSMYALVRTANGELKRQGPQIETTNPKVIELAIRFIREKFEANKWEKDKKVCIPLGPSDGGAISVSPESQLAGSGRISPDCGKADGTDLVILFLNTILEKTKDEFPNLYLGFFLYSWHADYPMKYKPDPRVAIEVADINFSRFHGIGDASSKSRYYYKGILEQWGTLHKEQGNPIIYRPYSWNLADGYLPFSKLKSWGDDIPFMKKIGAYGLSINAYNDWAVDGAHTYMAVRMGWDPALDWKKVLRHYCEKSFGKGADAMEKFYLALVERQSKAGQEAGSIYPYLLMYDQGFLDDMNKLFQEAESKAEASMDKKRIEYAHLPMEHLQKYLDFRRDLDELRLVDAQKIYQTINKGIADANEENVHIVGSQGTVFLGSYFTKFLEAGIKYSSGDYSIVYKIPDRLKTAIDRDSYGQHLNYFGREISDSRYFETSTFKSTWDAQGLAGYRSGAVWYRIHFVLPAVQTDAEHYGLFVGGVDNNISVWCNGKFIGSAGGGLTTPHVFELSGVVEPGKENLLAFQVRRIGNYELGTGGIMLPCFVFKGPQFMQEDNTDNRPYRVLPGGVIEYIKD